MLFFTLSPNLSIASSVAQGSMWHDAMGSADAAVETEVSRARDRVEGIDKVDFVHETGEGISPIINVACCCSCHAMTPSMWPKPTTHCPIDVWHHGTRRSRTDWPSHSLSAWAHRSRTAGTRVVQVAAVVDGRLKGGSLLLGPAEELVFCRAVCPALHKSQLIHEHGLVEVELLLGLPSKAFLVVLLRL
ncbi:hypothetical protein BDZ90DRAFT_127122 [Jaminaea rosea]|uniref:Uncharacterized protein n=1 Tax=Jaminaea rosea TaxID=1569628 RepID=A0A316UMC7_9BASI|nr:hypothetical protein BDZ90DRAFT_127122 [Jaminaea rosea]PWN24325.1 hypothetical protein BDZ90DRAFT_127122 [Jaminaea rosea]